MRQIVWGETALFVWKCRGRIEGHPKGNDQLSVLMVGMDLIVAHE